MYILPFYDTLYAAYEYVYRGWLPDDGWVVHRKHVGACVNYCAVVGNK
jgi:hypothetical protein